MEQAIDVAPKALQGRLSRSTISAAFNRDFSKTSEAEKVEYVVAVCKVLDIPTPLNPFYFMKLRPDKNGVRREILYPGAEATQLLAERNKINLAITSEKLDKENNIYFIYTRTSNANGRFADNFAAVYVGGETGQDRANAMMKCVTKAHRRGVLSFVGLSVADEDDLKPQVEETYKIKIPETTSGFPASIEEKIPEAVVVDAGARVAETPQKEYSEEDRAARLEVFRMLCGSGGPFRNAPVEAQEWILTNGGKSYNELTAGDCEELFAKIMDMTPIISNIKSLPEDSERNVSRETIAKTGRGAFGDLPIPD